MFIVFLVVFIDLLGFGIVLPLLPVIAKSYVQPVFPDSDATVGAIIGLLMSSFSLMQFLFAPMWGKLSDRIGRRPILLVGLLGSVAFYGLFGIATALPAASATLAMVLLFAARIGAGVSGATISTAQAVIADCTPPEKRKHGMALIGAAFGIGFTFGPLIGFACLHLANYEPLIGFSASAMSLIALILGLILLRETRQFGSEPVLRRQLFDIAAIHKTLLDSAVGPVILTFFIASLGFGSFEVTLALFLKDNFGFGQDESFLIFAYIGFVLMLTQGLLYRRLASRVSEVTFMAMGIFCMAVGVALLGWITYSVSQRYQHEFLPAMAASAVGQVASTEQGPLLAATQLVAPRVTGTGNLAFLFIALTAAVMGFAFLTPSAQALISRRTAADRQGEILGVNQAASAMARILGPILGVTLYMSTPTHLPPYIAGAILLLLMLPMLPRIKKSEQAADSR
ncbi:MAG TPA: MFS transporter [Gemmataceae bacterium]|nr:MFS transporter [Gemmataceae bacterium]